MEAQKKIAELDSEFGHLFEAGKTAKRRPGTMMCLNPSPDMIAQIRRKDLKIGAEFFHRIYKYDEVNNTKEQKTCIWPDNSHLWLDNSSGIMWVGVHGKDSICVVTRAGDLDLARVSGNANNLRLHEILQLFRKSVIDEIEDLADPSSELRKKLNKSIEKPFGVVCVIPGTNKEYDEKTAIEFLQKAVKSDEDFSINIAIRTAISGLQHLFQKKFKANEIEVSVMDPNYLVPISEKKDLTIQDLPIRRIKDHLVVINDPYFEGKEPDAEELELYWILKDMADRGVQKKNKANP